MIELKTKETKVTVAYHLPEWVADEISRLAKEHNLSKSDVVTQLMERVFANVKKDK